MDSTPKHRTSIIQHVFTLVNSTKVRLAVAIFAIMFLCNSFYSYRPF